jgi:hypothetical protein
VGTKRPDQISSDQWRRGVETVRQMHERRWELVGRCRSCGVALLVDLRVTISMLGPVVRSASAGDAAASWTSTSGRPG